MDNETVEISSREPHQNASPHETAPKISTINLVAVVIAAILVVAAFVLASQLLYTADARNKTYDAYNSSENAATDLMIVSDYLTTQSRMYVVTGDRNFLDGYLKEAFVEKNREISVGILSNESNNEHATSQLNAALGESNELETHELYAMKLTALAVDLSPMPKELQSIELTKDDEGLDENGKRKLAEEMVLGEDYRELKSRISQDVDDCAKSLVSGLHHNLVEIDRRFQIILIALAIIACLLMALVVISAVANYLFVMRPMKIHAQDMATSMPLSMIGCQEIKSVARSYNDLYWRIRKQTEDLKQQAETDPLTGLLNRGSYDRLMEEGGEHRALILIDVDKFKDVNDTYGHGIGDKVLIKVANAITAHFRDSDYVCRIGGDEFAVILTKVKKENQDAIKAKLESITEDLANVEDGLPLITLSYGAVFADSLHDGDSLYHQADKALYESKRNGRNMIVFYEGD